MATDQNTMFPDTQALHPTREAVGPNSDLASAVLAYQDYMKQSGFSPHTVKAFSGDLRLLQRYFPPSTLIHELGTQELNQFLYWLQYERTVSCSPKSYARRVTTLKSFFGWLTSIKVTPFDPAAPILHQKITTPLPKVLQDEEIDRLLAVTESIAAGPKKDMRPKFLTLLLLETGMKKAEVMRLTMDDFEDSDPENPTVLIRYSDPRMLHKERRLNVSAELLAAMRRYSGDYKVDEVLFTCTPRNLEYVLTDAATEASLSNGASFEMLRWTSAYRDFRDEMPLDQLQTKMGISKVTFRETVNKLEKISKGETIAA